MNTKELEKNGKKKNCTDCLHCKVSVKSTDDCRLFFCSEIGRKAAIIEFYWLNKPVCQKFEDMDV